jgi:hypothetical protein
VDQRRNQQIVIQRGKVCANETEDLGRPNCGDPFADSMDPKGMIRTESMESFVDQRGKDSLELDDEKSAKRTQFKSMTMDQLTQEIEDLQGTRDNCWEFAISVRKAIHEYSIIFVLLILTDIVVCLAKGFIKQYPRSYCRETDEDLLKMSGEDSRSSVICDI